MAEYKNDDMLERIKDSVKVPVPDSLKPDSIETMLQQRKANAERTEKQKIETKTWQSRKYIYRRICAGLAAAAVLAAGTFVFLNGAGLESKGGKDSGSGTKGAALEDNSLQLNPKEQESVNGSGQGFGETKTEQSQEEWEPESLPVVTTEFTTAESYKQLHYLLYQNTYAYMEEMEVDGYVSESTESNVALQQDAGTSSDSSLGMGSGFLMDYSKTNIQEEGVYEADVMVTDGTYIYQCIQGGLRIVKPDTKTGKLTETARIDLEVSMEDVNIYLEKNQLVVVGTNTSVCETRICSYDITDKQHPVSKGVVKISGRYETSRLTDSYLYVFANYGKMYISVSDPAFKSYDTEGYIPLVQDEKMELTDIYVPCLNKANGYLMGVSVDLSNPSKPVDQLAILMNSSEFYVSQSNIFVAETSYSGKSITDIYKFSYKDGQMEPVADGSVNGTINDSFSMDEYNGYLRLVTTGEFDSLDGDSGQSNAGGVLGDGENLDILIDVPTTANHLYILDEDLQITGSIENLAPGERIYSARFMGDMGFFVTYRQTDPLFSVDLSDPSKPVLLGALKISGFSEYLHPYGENRLLGIGWETQVLNSGGTKTVGMKLSMFDTSDMADVKETEKLVLEEAITTGLHDDDHRALLINIEKNLFGMAVVNRVGNNTLTYYYTFKYTEGEGFVKHTETLLEQDSYVTDGIRGVYIGDILYIGSRITDASAITAVSLEDGRVLDELAVE